MLSVKTSTVLDVLQKHQLLAVICFFLAVLLDKGSFLSCTNLAFGVLNYLDGTTPDRTLNPFAGTAAEEFARPLSQHEIGSFLDIPVTFGQIPSALNEGILLRIGANNLFHSPVGLHVIEADGLLHSFRFDSQRNTVSMSSAFMETPKVKIEREWNQGIYGTAIEEIFMALNGDESLWVRAIKVIKFLLCAFVQSAPISPFAPSESLHDFNCANTATLQWNGRLFATCEASHFFEFELNATDMSVDSVGFTKLNASWIDYPFVAHPRIDTFNDDNLLVVGHDFAKSDANLAVGVFDREYNLLNAGEIPLHHKQMVHEMSQTEHFMLIFDTNLWFGEDMLREHGQMFQFVNTSTASSRIGVIDKAAFASGDNVEQLVRWFEIDACLFMHTANAWEEGDSIKMVAPRFENFDMDMMMHLEAVSKREGYAMTEVYEWTLNLTSGAVEEGAVGTELSGIEMPEMPLVHPLFEARKAQFIWFNLIDHSLESLMTSSHGIAKYDVDRREIVGTIEYDNFGNFGSFEAVFVPKEREDVSAVQFEDEGYLVNVIWDKETDLSTLQIFDASTMSSEPIALIELPYRIPAGFHSNFIFES